MDRNFNNIDSRIIVLCLAVLITGISTGLFFEVLVPEEDKLYLLNILRQAVSDSGSSFIQSAASNLLVLGLIFIAGISIYGFPVTPLILFINSLSFGFCIPLVSQSMPVFRYISSFVIPCSILLIIRTIAVVLSINYALPQLHTRSDRSDAQRSYIISFTVLAAAHVFILFVKSIIT